MTEILKTVGDRVKALRKVQGLSQGDLASLAGVHKSFIGQLELGDRNITLLSLEKIANALGVPIAELVRNDNDVLEAVMMRSLGPIKLMSEDDREVILQVLTILQEWKQKLRKN